MPEQYPVFGIENSNGEKYLLYASRYLSRWRDVNRQVSLLIHQFVDFPQNHRYFHVKTCIIHTYLHKYLLKNFVKQIYFCIQHIQVYSKHRVKIYKIISVV